MRNTYNMILVCESINNHNITKTDKAYEAYHSTRDESTQTMHICFSPPRIYVVPNYVANSKQNNLRKFPHYGQNFNLPRSKLSLAFKKHLSLLQIYILTSI